MIGIQQSQKKGSKSEGHNDGRRATEMKINDNEEQQGTHVCISFILVVGFVN